MSTITVTSAEGANWAELSAGSVVEAFVTTQRKIRLKVASPCNASWDDMEGDDAVRHCRSCNKSVYQLSKMSSSAIEELLAGQDEVCGRFFQRADGTVMTADCSVGHRRRRRRNLVLGASAAALSALGLGLAEQAPPPLSAAQVSGHAVSSSMPTAAAPDFPEVEEEGVEVMGAVAFDIDDVEGGL